MTAYADPFAAMYNSFRIEEAHARADQAKAGCTADHSKVRMLCDACGWHEHECPSCHHIWDHDAILAVSTEDDYAKGHLCPSCGTDQRLRRQRFGRSTDAIEKGMRLHAALEMLELMILLEEMRMVSEFERFKLSDPFAMRINPKYYTLNKFDLDV